MRVSKEKLAENRERILEAAARLFRERGLAGAGVEALADAAGLTHGALYSQFGSKDQLAAAALEHALAGSAARTGQARNLGEYASLYLSRSHRDTPGEGCALAALGCDVQRQSNPLRQAFTAGVRRMATRLSQLVPGANNARREQQALATAATLVGALVLARAVDDPQLSNDILRASREWIGQQQGPTTE